MKINDNERKILKILADDFQGFEGEPGFWSFAPLVEKTGLDRRQVRLACRSLTRKGLAQYSRALQNLDGEFKGAGYGATRAGASLMNPCDLCSDFVEYDWWEKDNEVVFSTTEGATHHKLCAEHYESHTANPKFTL